MRASSLLLGALLCATGLGAAPSRPPACADPEYRQFDFWIGDWDVYDPKGGLKGRNVVTREFGGCVLQEHWTAGGPIAQTGSSFNTWSPARKRWHQTWVDSTGGFLLLDGEFRDGAMVLSGEGMNRQGVAVRNRITWSTLGEGKVRQLWESSRDQGQSWRTVFDGTYVRRPARNEENLIQLFEPLPHH
jgi:hypothetical protein